MRINLFITFLIFVLGCNDYELVEESKVNFKGEGDFIVKKYYKDKNNKNDYLMVKTDISGNKEFEAEVRNHNFYSFRKHYYSNGKLKQIDSFITECDISNCGSKIFSKEFAQNGNLKTEHYLENCLHNGICRSYDTITKKLLTELNYKNDKLNGKQLDYFENGRLRNQYYAKNDTIIGLAYSFDTNGDTLEISHYINNKKTLPYTEYRKDTILVGNYTNIKREFVTWKFYNRNWVLLKEEIVKNSNGEVNIP